MEKHLVVFLPAWFGAISNTNSSPGILLNELPSNANVLSTVSTK